MTIELHWFSVLREQVGVDREMVEFDGGTAGDLYERLAVLHAFALPVRSLRVAINDAFAEWDSPLSDRDRVVYIAPVGGG
jgi:molybdopterin synthase sulfur carrier subunit